MKKNRYHSMAFLVILALITAAAFGQDSSKKELLIDLGYCVPAHRIPYLQVQTKTRVEKRFLPTEAVRVKIYLDSLANLIAEVTTDINGSARVTFPPSLKTNWDASPTHTFIAAVDATNEFDETSAEISVTKAKLLLDTVADAETKSVRVQVMALKDNQWSPANEVELKIGIRRLGGDLPVSDEETYTSDSTGEVVAEFKREKLPGDSAGTIILVAKVEDNEKFGNLAIEKSVPWGTPSKVQPKFHERTLWATRDKAPAWLLLMAGFIMVVVWGTIFHLILQIVKIRRLGLRNN